MKTENFDEAIRKKLEGLPQKVTEQDVDKVFRFVTRHRGPFYSRIGGHGLIYTALVGVIAGLVWWNLALRNQPEHTATPAADPKTSISKSSVSAQAKQDESQAIDSKPIAQAPEKSSQNTANTTVDKIVQFTPIKQIAIEKQTEKLETTATKDFEKPLITVDQTTPDVGMAITPLLPFFQNTLVSSVNALPAHNLPLPKNTKLTLSLGSDPKEDLASQNGTKKPQKTKRANAYKPTKNSSGNHLATNAKRAAKPFFIDLEARATTGFEVNNTQLGIGAQFELIAAKHWGLSTGVKYMFNKGETFNNEQDFFDKKSKHIHQVYGDKPQFHGDISDIELNTSVLQIPVQFSYYYPFKNGLSVSLGIATGFDVYASSDLRFNNRPGRDSLNHQIDLKAAPSIQTFNNLIVSAGIQKRWNRWAISASPYIGNQLIKVDYRKEDWFYGVGINLSYYLFN